MRAAIVRWLPSNITSSGPLADVLSPVRAIGLETQDSIHDEVMRRLFGEEPSPPMKFGRYEVVGRLGAGAMGSVYLARDPELNREVAIKILRLELAADRKRLVAEAQAMARLSHPNVVSVFDVGDRDGQIFVAMERIDGVNLRVWQEDDRAWRDVARVYLDAARGLAAAHAAGIVHRDFKPDNVLIGRDGIVKVTDFGVATVLPPDAVVETLRDEEPQSDPWLRATGGAGGTPAYMSPEQLQGLGGDPQSDQFSFCVALFEALAGYRPFASDSVAELVQKTLDGEQRPPPVSSGVPAAVWRVVRRGLSSDPNGRHSSMAEMSSALERCLRPAWRRRLALGGAGLVLASAVGGAMAYRHYQQVACTEVATEAVREWDEQRATVRDGLLDSEVGYGPATWRQVDRDLTAWAEAWHRERADVCAAGKAESADQMRRTLCLDEKLREFGGLLGVLATHDAVVAENAVRAAAGLGDPARCIDSRWLAAAQPPPPPGNIRSAVDDAREELARARALSDAGKSALALEVARKQYSVAETVNYAPLSAEAALLIGVAQDSLGDYASAELALVDAVSHSNAAGASETGALASLELLNTVGARLERYDDGKTWATLADGYIERLGPGGEDLVARRLVMLAQVETRHGNPAEAVALVENARVVYEGLDATDLSWARLWAVEATARSALGEGQAALDLRTRVEATTVELLGDSHPYVATARLNLGIALAQRGDFEGAIGRLSSALDLNVAAYGADHPDNARILNNLANLAVLTFAYGEAESLQRRAIALNKKVYGADDPRLLRNLSNLGIIQLRQGKTDDALSTFERVVEAYEASEDPLALAEALLNLATATSAKGDLLHTRALLLRAKGIFDSTSQTVAGRGATLHNLANATRSLGALEEALGYAEEAVKVVRARLGGDNPELVKPLSLRARLLFETGDIEAARDAIAVLLPRVDDDLVDRGSAADILLTHADLLSHDGAEKQARASANRALSEAESQTAESEAAKEWLREHP